MANAGYKGLKRRSMLVGSGIFVLLFGFLAQSQGEFMWANWLNQPVFSAAVIATGAFLVVLGLIPSSWMARATSIRGRQQHRLGRESHSGKH